MRTKHLAPLAYACAVLALALGTPTVWPATALALVFVHALCDYAADVLARQRARQRRVRPLRRLSEVAASRPAVTPEGRLVGLTLDKAEGPR